VLFPEASAAARARSMRRGRQGSLLVRGPHMSAAAFCLLAP
jgi:hypothetical protein